MLYFFYALNCALLLSGLAALPLASRDRNFSLALVRVLLGLPLLAAQYFYIAHYFQNYIISNLQTPLWLLFKPSTLPLLPQLHIVYFQEQLIPYVLFFETVFALLWFSIAYQLHNTLTPQSSQPRHPVLTQLCRHIEIWGGLPLIGTLLFYHFYQFDKIETQIRTNAVVFPAHSLFFITDILILISMLFMAWRLENFWRCLSSKQRWEYKYLVIGGYVVCGALAWAASYRFMYHQFVLRHFWLLAVWLMFGWALMVYATVRHRLLNRKIYISRKVVYSFVAPVVFSFYLIVLGAVAFAMRLLGWEFPFVLKWLLLITGLVTLIVIAFSVTLRRKVKFFISTNFYVNKYEYRDEWLAFSRRLQGVLTETEVVKALYNVLADSLYTLNVCIWLGDDKQGYRLAISGEGADSKLNGAYHLDPDDALIAYLKKYQHYYRINKKTESAKMPDLEKRNIVTELALVLFMPLMIGEQMLGLIALGREFTGGKYGTDDFDLLTALGTQTASALLAVRMAEKLALAREQKAVDIMSAFILHDVKNAAGMLSLIRQNANDYMNDPEFQQDMLDTIDDALKRMGKVQTGLKTLKGEITPTLKDENLEKILTQIISQLERRLQGLSIKLHCEAQITLKTDADLLRTIFENLLLNALEAGSGVTKVNIRYHHRGSQSQAIIEVTDNGPGLPSELLPDAVFEPFKTTKSKGSGIGLWQVKRIVACLNGTITAGNHHHGGAQFCVSLPIKEPYLGTRNSDECQTYSLGTVTK